jgi:hypothetical protein
MPKKDVSEAVAGMLSAAGAQTRPSARPVDPRSEMVAAATPAPVRDEPAPPAAPAPVQVPAPPVSSPASRESSSAPTTLRLRPKTAQNLRDAWLEAKRDDVLLTAQDFASSLLDDALALRRRRSSRAS